jgi:hypothetical protein
VVELILVVQELPDKEIMVVLTEAVKMVETSTVQAAEGEELVRQVEMLVARILQVSEVMEVLVQLQAPQ